MDLRKLIGIAAFTAGLVVLGLWLVPRQAAILQYRLAVEADAVLRTAVHGMAGRVSGRDILVSGIADGIEEEQRILKALSDLPHHRHTVTNLFVIPAADPFTITGTKTAEGLTWSGHVPTEPTRHALGEQIGVAQAGGLVLAAGAPTDGWERAVLLCHRALRHLEDGRVEVVGQDVSLTGTARTPVEVKAARATLADLPPGYTVVSQVTPLDDGTPFHARIVLTAKGAVWEDGKLPKGITTADLAAEFDGALTGSVPVAAITDETDDWASTLASALHALSFLSTGEVDLTGPHLALSGFGTTPSDLAQAEAELAVLPAGFTADIRLEIADDGRPFFLDIRKHRDGTDLSGKLPHALSQAELARVLPGPVRSIDLSPSFLGADRQDWRQAALLGVRALAVLRQGQLDVGEGGEVALTGLAATPTDRRKAQDILRRIPSTKDVVAQITVVDDGWPFTLQAEVTGGAVRLKGKIPANAGDVLKHGVAHDWGGPHGVQIAPIGADRPDWPAALEAMLAALPHLHNGAVTLTDDSLTVAGEVMTPDDETGLRDAVRRLPAQWARSVRLRLRLAAAPTVR